MTWRLTRGDADFRREIDAHLALETDRFIADGLAPDAARRAARRAFGNVTRTEERFYESRQIMWIDDLVRDVRHALLTLRRAPGFTVVAVLTLAIGLGATTAISSIVDTILVQPLPFADADRLVRVVENVPHVTPGRPPLQNGAVYQAWIEWRNHTQTLSEVAGITYIQANVRTVAGAARLLGGMTSANVFTMLGRRAMFGRTLGPEDAGRQDVVVLTYDTWQRFFHSDRNVVGTSMAAGLPSQPGDRSLTIIGVLPDDFVFPTGQPIDFYMPMALDDAFRRYSFDLIGRLDPRASLKAATDEANIIGRAIPMRNPSAPPLTIPRFEVHRVKEQAVRDLGPYLRLLLAVVAVVLLIVCANVANLLLARGTARHHEMAARAAVGASRARLIRQVLTEGLVLALVGGTLGALVAAGAITLVKNLASVEAPGIFRYSFGASILPRVHEIGINLKMFGFAFGLAVLTNLLFSVFPALQLSRATARELGMRGGTAGAGERRVRSTLVVAQLVMATVLLIGAGLLARSFVKLSTVERGYDPAGVVAFQLVFPVQYEIPKKTATIEALLQRLRAMPGVEAAGFTRAGVLIPEELYVGTFVPQGETLERMRVDAMRPAVRSVSPGYLTAIGARLLDGREFAPDDDQQSMPPIVVTRTVARRYFGGARAVGQIVDWHLSNSFTTPSQIIGVVEDLRNDSPARDPKPEIFVDYRQLLPALQRSGDPVTRQNTTAIGFLSFAIRTRGQAGSAAPAVEQIVRSVDPNVGMESILPLDRLVANSVARERFYSVMVGMLAGIAAFLAAIGVYGVLAYNVIQRRREIGIRRALGARPGQVVQLILSQGAMLIVVGLVAGTAGAAATTQWLRSMLFGVTPLDPATFVAVAILFGSIALFASYLPARRAAGVDPITVLKVE
jgi:putative ABC transport system permease protein